jgi:hypothetical protein
MARERLGRAAKQGIEYNLNTLSKESAQRGDEDTPAPKKATPKKRAVSKKAPAPKGKRKDKPATTPAANISKVRKSRAPARGKGKRKEEEQSEPAEQVDSPLSLLD